MNVKVEMRNSRGLWNALSPLELVSSPKIAEMLKPFVRPITDCYECGVEVPTLPCKHETTKDIGVAALFYLPFWCDSALPAGVWFGSERGRKLAVWSVFTGAVVTVVIILADNLMLSSAEVAGNTLIIRGLLNILGRKFPM